MAKRVLGGAQLLAENPHQRAPLRRRNQPPGAERRRGARDLALDILGVSLLSRPITAPSMGERTARSPSAMEPSETPRGDRIAVISDMRNSVLGSRGYYSDDAQEREREVSGVDTGAL